MALSIARVRHYLREFALEKLLVEELGWDRHAAQLTVRIDGQSYTPMVRTKSGGDSTVRPEFVIRGMLFHPTRLKG
jgi:hypothetical protein